MHLFIPRGQLLCDYVNNSICFEYMNCGGERRRGRREAKENSRTLRGGAWMKVFCFVFFKRRTVVLLSSPLPFNSHWPVVSGWLKRSAAKSHQQTQQRGLNTCRQSPCVVRGEKFWAVRDLKSVEFMRLSWFKLLTSIFKFIVDSATDNLIHFTWVL